MCRNVHPCEVDLRFGKDSIVRINDFFLQACYCFLIVIVRTQDCPLSETACSRNSEPCWAKQAVEYNLGTSFWPGLKGLCLVPRLEIARGLEALPGCSTRQKLEPEVP